MDQSVLLGGNGHGAQSMDLEVTIAMLFTVLGFFWLVGRRTAGRQVLQLEHTLKPLPALPMSKPV